MWHMRLSQGLVCLFAASILSACSDKVCEPLETAPFNFGRDPKAEVQRLYPRIGFQLIVMTGAYDDFPLSTRNQIWLGEVLNNQRSLDNERVIPIYVDDIHRDKACDGQLPKVRAFAQGWNDAMLDRKPGAGLVTAKKSLDTK